MVKHILIKTSWLILLSLLLCPPSIPTHAQTIEHPGFYVQGRHLYDRFGNKVILVGVNKMAIWTDRDGLPAFPEIAKTGANVVRIVWLTEGSSEELDIVISNAHNHQLIPMIDCHDSTGNWQLLTTCVDYWVRADILEVLKKHENYLLINIANEAGKGVVNEWEFRAAYELAIKRMRLAGIHVPLIIDAQGFGQNINDLQKNGPYLIQADPDHNLMFSIHMWWPTAWRGPGVAQMVIDEIAESVEMELPLIVGEFANKGPGCSCCIPYRTIIEQCQINEIGYLAWSWGPGNGDCAEMDMTEDGAFDTLHGWGLEVAMTSTHSIQAIAIRPDWIVNATPIPTNTPAPVPTSLAETKGILSIGQPVSVSSSEADNLSGEAAVDGRLNTRWSSAWSDPQDITIDLGETKQIGRIVLEWETAYGKEYTIQVSDDAESWIQIIQEANSDGGRDDHLVSALGRYVRIVGTKRATEWGYSLYEIWVLDSAETPLPEVTQAEEIAIEPDLRPDLVINSIEWSPENLTLNSDVRFRAIVENQGKESTQDSIQVLFTIDNKVVGQGFSENPLPAGETITIESADTWYPDETRTIIVLAQVDGDFNSPQGVVDEVDEFNNLFSAYSRVKNVISETNSSVDTETPSPQPASTKIPITPSLDSVNKVRAQVTERFSYIWYFAVITIIIGAIYLIKIRLRK